MICWPSFLLGMAATAILAVAVIAVLAALAFRAPPRPPRVVAFAESRHPRRDDAGGAITPRARQRRPAHLRLC